MNNSTFLSLLYASALAITSITADAALVDRGDGLIYDSDQDLTWTQDAGMSGWVTWDEAMAWAGGLVFGGFDDWRLPTTTQFDDPTCSRDVRGYYFNEVRLDCTGGEMERLTATHAPYYHDIFKDADGKRTVNKTRYWMSTPYRDGTDPCIGYPDTYDAKCYLATTAGDHIDFFWQWGFWGFQPNPDTPELAAELEGRKFDPFKTTLNRTNERYAWAVRDGDVCGGYNLAANRWTMISLACTPASPATPESVFGDDLIAGQYGIRWVIYEWDADTDSYSKMPLSDPFKPLSQNKGYWIISLDAASLDIEGSVTAAPVSDSQGCVVTQGCYEIPLTPPDTSKGENEQYNLVGHVFPGTVPIPWEDVRIKITNTTDGSLIGVYKHSDPEFASYMDKTIWLYNGNAYDSFDDVTAGKEGQLSAFDGFWVRTLPGASAVTSTLLLPKVPAP